MRRLFFILVVLFGPPLFSQARHPLTFEDTMKLKRIAEPEVSPNGKWVLFSAVDVDLAANTKTPHVWMVPTSGGQAKEIIAGQNADRPRWSPDGRRFAFLSTKEGGSQVWIGEFDGTSGSVRGVYKLTSMPTEASGELWSPDGQFLLFTSDVYPECDGRADEIGCNAKSVEEANQSKVKAMIFDRLLYRHWNAYREGKRTHLFVIPAGEPKTGGKARPRPSLLPEDRTPGDYDAPVFSLGGQDNYAFSPDGREICYTSNHDNVEATSTNNDLWIVPVSSTPGVERRPGSGSFYSFEASNITSDNPASDSTPRYSPDGNYIAYRAQSRPGYESDRFRLMLYDRKTGEKKDLTEGFDHWVESFVWAPDSKEIYFSAEHERHSLIYAVNAVGTAGTTRTPTEYLRRSLVAGNNDDLAMTPDGKTLVFTRTSLSAPNEIYAADSRGEGCPARTGEVDPGEENCSLNRDWALTHSNDRLLSQISMSKVESFEFPGANGDAVEGSLVEPPDFDARRKYPVKFLIHGGPEGAWGDDWSYRWNPELFAANGYVVIMINFHGSTGYGQKFVDAINGDWGGAPFEDLMKGLDFAEKTYPFIDKDRECALGASYGGYMANWILGHTDRFKCIVSHDGMFNAESAWGDTEELWFNEREFKGTPYDNRELYRKWSPHQYAKNFKTPTLVVHGQLDYRLDVSQGFDLFTTLQRENVPSKMLYFPDEGHWVLKPQNSQLWYKTVNDWVDRWVGK